MTARRVHAATGNAARESELLTVSLAVCSRNRPQLLAETVASILDGEQIPAELIIVDQSDEPHAELSRLEPATECQIHYLWVQPRGVAAARNMALSSARHEICVLTDDDILVSPDWLSNLVQAQMQAGPRAVVTGQVRSAPEDSGERTPSLKEDAHPVVYEGRINDDVLYTGNMAIFRSTFEDVGGFDECLGPGTKYPAAEDNDLGFRLLEQGYRIHYVPEAIVYHRSWRSERDFLALKWRYGVGRGAYYAKHASLRDRYMLARMTRDIGFHVLLFVGHLRREKRRAHGDALLTLGILRGAVGWWLEHIRGGK
ncbi:MAG TPA: glycosyltransferase [Candidatus Sulfomarinibacteraceae bacterium]|nr:glycosyltransferase [Candidatus Sulfomarinibacteraceae bacterium]